MRHKQCFDSRGFNNIQQWQTMANEICNELEIQKHYMCNNMHEMQQLLRWPNRKLTETSNTSQRTDTA